MNFRKHVAGVVLACSIAGLAACTSPVVVPVVAPVAPAVATPKGEVKGSQTAHGASSRLGLIANAQVVLPAGSAGTVFVGKWRDIPATGSARYPVVLFLHGSSGLGLAAIGEWQRWLAAQGIASVAPDSFALPDRLTYKSPVSK